MKLLVTTDFSANSKGAMRFAQTLAKQSEGTEVVFYHAIQIMKPTSWNDDFYKIYKTEELKRLTDSLQRFVQTTLGKDIAVFTKVKYIVENCLSTEKSIIEYARRTKMDYICIATEGAGMLRKMMGTHTSHVVRNALTPVLVIPSHYRSKPLKRVTYLSDFENLKRELNTTTKFSDKLGCDLSVLHFASLVVNEAKLKRTTDQLSKGKYSHVHWIVSSNNLEASLISKVDQYVTNSKPEMLVMFTQRKKSFFESLFLPSKSAELTYTTKIPVLIFSK